MINLSDATPFAEGGNRKCYVHPNNPDRCLKVIHSGLLEKITSKPFFGEKIGGWKVAPTDLQMKVGSPAP